MRVHLYEFGANYKFPPLGTQLEVGVFAIPIDPGELVFKRLNLDVQWLAWLSTFVMVEKGENDELKRKWKDSANKISCRVHLLAGETVRRVLAYDLQEDLDKNKERLGHSPLTRSREVTAVQSHLINSGERGNAVNLELVMQPVRWASKDSALNLPTIRQLLRVLRRLSLSVIDQSQPTYKYSGLFHWANVCDSSTEPEHTTNNKHNKISNK